MKKTSTIIAALLITASVFAQTPEKMSYQAIVRDGSNNLLTSKAVGMQISVLKGSVTGSAVYVETQKPKTNVNGLVSIQIGSGIVQSGTFSVIDWVNGPYFIKTETDPTGGTNYTISGTSQLMSVPYALHAKTAETITGTITETDPVFGSSIASGINALDTANWNNHTLDADTQLDSLGISSLGYVAGSHTIDTHIDSLELVSLGFVSGLHTVNTDTQLDSVGVSKLGYVAGPHTDSSAISNMGFVTKSSCGLAIGDTISGGGIIFYLDASGCHGLVCTPKDQSSGIRWYGGVYKDTYAYGNGIGAGAGNESAILKQGGSGYATLLFYGISMYGYSDWYVPSRYELNLMYMNIGQGNSLGLGNIGGFNSSEYWSSTERYDKAVWIVNFSNGKIYGELKSRIFRVRGVRSF